MTATKKKTARKKTTKKKVKKKAATKSKKLATRVNPNHRQAELILPENLGKDERIKHLEMERIVKGESKLPNMSSTEQVEHIIALKENEEQRDPYKREMSKYSDAADRLAFQMRSEGKGRKQIAEALGVNTKTILRWKELHASFCYCYAHGRYMYVRGMCERVLISLGKGKSITHFAASEGVNRMTLHRLEKAHKMFAEAKQMAMQAAQAYWEDVLQDQAEGKMYGMVRTELMTYQGKVILDKEDNEIPVMRAHNKPYSDKALLVMMSNRFEDYRLNRDQSDNELGSQLDRALQRQRERLTGKS